MYIMNFEKLTVFYIIVHVCSVVTHIINKSGTGTDIDYVWVVKIFKLF